MNSPAKIGFFLPLATPIPVSVTVKWSACRHHSCALLRSQNIGTQIAFLGTLAPVLACAACQPRPRPGVPPLSSPSYPQAESSFFHCHTSAAYIFTAIINYLGNPIWFKEVIE
jgi:hypothetical protein